MGKGSSTTTSTSAPSSTAQNGFNVANAADVSAASQPFNFFPGQTVAGLTDQQLAGMSEVNNATGIANPYINNAATMTQAATQPIGAQQINQYMNPYLSDVASTTSAEINQNNAVQQNQLQGNAAALGALGGNRVGTAQAQLAGQQDLAENQTMAGIYEGGYNTALGAAQTTNAQQLQGADVEAGLGSEAQNTALAGANAQLAAGSTAQTEQQNQLNSAYSQFEASQAFPFESSEFLTSAEEGLGSLEGGTSGTTVPPPSVFSQIVGGSGAILGTVGDLKRGGRVERAAGGVAGFDGGGGVVNPGGMVNPNYLAGVVAPPASVGSTLPGAPPPIDPNAKTDGSQSGKSGGSGGGLGGIAEIAGMLKRGGRAGYDMGGALPYSSEGANYLSGIASTSGGTPHGQTIPKPPPGIDPNAGTDGSKSSASATGASAANSANTLIQMGKQIFGGQGSEASGAMAPTQASTFLSAPGLETAGTLVNPNQNYTIGQEGGSAGFARGGGVQDNISRALAIAGRPKRASGGTSGSASSAGATPTGGISTTISPGQQTLQEEMENYSLESSLMPGAQAPKYSYGASQPSENPVEADEQAEGQPLKRGGLARLPRASGGTGTAAQTGLPAFTPAGGQAINAPQPTSTAGTQPTTWGNVALPSAPQLSTAPVAQMTPGSIQASIALPTGGIQNNYTGYIESLPGSNPSVGNVSPQGANQIVTQAPNPVPENMSLAVPSGSTINPFAPTANGLSLEQLEGFGGTGSGGFKKGGGVGRHHFDDGGQTNYQVDGSATPLSGQPPGLGAVGNTAPVVPVQSAPVAAPAPSAPVVQPAPQPAPANPVPGLGAMAAPPAGAPSQGIAAAKPVPAQPQQGVAAVAPQAAAGAQGAPDTVAQRPVNNPFNLKVPGNPNAYQQFNNPIDGLDAGYEQLTLDNKPVKEGGHGLSTLTALISNYAPPSENDTAQYIKNVSQWTGIDPNAPLDLSDPATLASVGEAMLRQEQGKKGAPTAGTQVAQNTVQQPPFVNGQVASDASPGLGYSNPNQPPLGNPGIPDVNSNPYAGAQTHQEQLANNPWLALAAAGFATMAGTSPYAAVNIGQGGLAGIQYLQGIQGQQRANAATQQAQTTQQQQEATQKQQQEVNQSNQFISELNQMPNLSAAQRSALGFNQWAANNGIPQQPIPGLPPGLPAFAVQYAPGYTVNQTAQPPSAQPQTTTGAVGMGQPSVGPQLVTSAQGGAVASTQFAQNVTGLPAAAPATVDTSVIGPNGQQMPYQQAFRMAMSDVGSPYAPAAAQGNNWLSQNGPQANQAGVAQLQQIANTGAQQSQQLDELNSEAKALHPGPVSGPILSTAVKTIQDVSSLFGINVGDQITDASNAAQVIPKLSTTLLAAAGKMASDVGGAETLQMMQTSVPTISNTGTGIQQIVDIYNTMNQRSQALANYANAFVSQGVGNLAQAQGSFNQQYPPKMWASRVTPLQMPSSAAQLQTGYSYQQNGEAFIWNGNGWSPQQ